ncbi:MAG: formate acetyltransferase [Bacteroidetes bacterium]|nr:formate acetyltransferase [Bacteroidota bacterium]
MFNEDLGRLDSLKKVIEQFPPAICIERALLITEYFRKKENRNKKASIQIAEALSHILKNKSTPIYPNELIVGSTTSKRVAGPLYPEMHGIPIMEDIFRFEKREVTPLQISKNERRSLLKKVLPFWWNKWMAYKSMPLLHFTAFVIDQLTPRFYLINETGGIGHFIPDYELLINKGLNGIISDLKAKMKTIDKNDERYSFYQAGCIICEGVISMAEKYVDAVELQIAKEKSEERKKELQRIAQSLRNVPANPARTLQEALQSIWLIHTAINLEGLDNGISFGRMDKYLHPFYKKDMEAGRINRQVAKELLGCFAIKSCEIIPVFSQKIGNCHGGLLSGQALVIGGMDKDGNDTTNELTYIFLELADEIRMRQPNYHARVHQNSPKKYIGKCTENLVKGAGSPALYNDELIVESMLKCGYSKEDSMEYATLGCVELNSPGKTCGSTDAALFNLPICLELALNQGKLFGSWTLKGCKTAKPASFKNIEDVKKAYKVQLAFLIKKMVNDLRLIELGNKNMHPIPLTSLLMDGCIKAGTDISAGGATYNFSGVQGVGVSDTGDALCALDELVFKQKKYGLEEVIVALGNNFEGAKKMRSEMLAICKFGNDDPDVDSYSAWAMNVFCDTLESHTNTRGGQFVAGFYSTTMHQYFGSLTGALPSGRGKGEVFTSGIAPMNGYDLKGPTAVFNSIASLDMVRAHNGANVNAKFDTATLKGTHGQMILESLVKTYFKRGGMQVQLNVLDTEMLKDAKLHPGKYPNLVVRVSGYSAYFNDLSPAMKDEIIARSCLA